MAKNRRHTDTKSRISDAALELYAAHGVDAVSIRDIVRKVGISAAGFYNHFSNKNELLGEMYRHYRDRDMPPGLAGLGELEPVLSERGPTEFIVAVFEAVKIGGTNPALERLTIACSGILVLSVSFLDMRSWEFSRTTSTTTTFEAKTHTPLSGDKAS